MNSFALRDWMSIRHVSILEVSKYVLLRWMLYVTSQSTTNCVTEFTKNKVDVFIIAKTKVDVSFPQTQFWVIGFSIPYGAYRNNKGGGILIYTRERIITKSIPIIFNSNNLEYLQIV